MESGHLGGYVIGGDSATFYPVLWRWLVEYLGVGSVIDVGCGEGQAIDFFAGLGCRVLGVEGIRQPHPWIARHDFTEGHFRPWGGPYDLAWCCEFVEHVDARHVDNFLATFEAADLVLMTHAEPGQDGYHHVNCQTAAYWIEQLARSEFAYDATLTAQTRVMAGANPSPWNHYVRSGLAFRRLRLDRPTRIGSPPGSEG